MRRALLEPTCRRFAEGGRPTSSGRAAFKGRADRRIHNAKVSALNEPVLSALGGDLLKFFAVKRGALEPIIAPRTVPNEMNSVVIDFCPSRSRNRVSTLTARIVIWKRN